MKSVSIVIIILAAVFSACSRGATYKYVSPSGNDSASGDWNQPWKSLGRVNTYLATTGLAAGDWVFFERGGTYDGHLEIYTDKVKGTTANPAGFAAYGSGADPVLRNLSPSSNETDPSTHVVYVEIPDTAAAGGGIYIGGIEIVGTTTGATRSSHGVMVFMRKRSADVTERIIIELVKVSGSVNGIGASRRSDTQGSTNRWLKNMEVLWCTVLDCPGLSNQSNNSGNGIVLGGVDNAYIANCFVDNCGANNTASAGPAGIWLWDASNCLIEYCTVTNMKTQAGDGDGFDFDGGVSNSTIQYCYAANNDGFGFLFAQYVGSPTDNYNNTYRYCIGENNGLDHGGSHNFSEVGYWSGDKKLRDNVVTHCAFKSVNPFVLAFTTGTGTIENNQIDNCIFYQDNSYSPWYALLDNVYPSDLHFLNNFYGKPASASNTDYFWVNGSTLTSLPAFRAAGQETLSGTSYGLSGDSLFQSGSEEDGFKLHAGSPARNASVSFPPAVPGSIDYFRNSAPVGTRDIGAHEVQ